MLERLSAPGLRFTFPGLVLMTGVLLASCSAPEAVPAAWTRQENIFGSIPATLTVFGPEDEELFQGFLDVITQVDQQMSMWDRPYETDIMRLAAAAGKNPVEVSADTLTVLKRAIEIGNATEGALDVAIGPLVKLWGIYTDHPQVPSQAQIDELLPLTRLDDLILAGKTAYLKKAGMVVDVGGIAKGWAADQAARYLKSRGVTSAIIDLGGNVYVIGAKPVEGGTRPWKIGIQDPFAEERGTILGTVSAVDTSLVTSGVYERKFTDPATGLTYHHILDPKTGKPSDSGLVSVTVVGPSSIDCDGFAKVLVLGLEKGWKVLKAQGLEGIFITDEKKVYVTPGLAKDFTLRAEGYQLADL